MILRQFLVEQDVLRECQKTIRDVFVQRHAAFECTIAEDPTAEHHGIHLIANDARHRMDEVRGVLIVGMQHDHDIRPEFEGFSVTALLVSTIALVLFVADNVSYAQLPGLFDGMVAAGIIHQHDFVNNVERNLSVCDLKRFFCIIRRKDHHHFLTVEHARNLGAKIKA